MAQPTNREEFKMWCMRKLGDGAIKINVTAPQVEDRIDEALSYYADYHFDGSMKAYTKLQVTQTHKTNKWVAVPENVLGVVNLFPVTSGMIGSGMFSAKYQFVLNNMSEFVNYNLTNYYMTMAHIGFMEELLVGRQPIRYNRHQNRLYIDMDWDTIDVGDYLIYECYEVVDPEVFSDVWKDRWLQNYATAKIKYQWGSNLTKMSEMQLPGGVRFNAEKIYDEAKEEILKLEADMIGSYSLPVGDMVG